MSLDETLLELVQPFIEKGLITEVLQVLKSGKEATVYACRGSPRIGGRLLAVKVYRPLEHRQFRDDSAYRAGRVILSGRVRRAVENGSDFGKEAAFGMWVGMEWQNLRELHAARIDVPRPIDRAESAIVLEYLGDEAGPAPQLRSVRLTPHEAAACWNRVLDNVTHMLRINRVHGDLSPYNLLWHQGRPWIIDVPQMVDSRLNPNAREMLTRDIENVHGYLRRFCTLPDPWKLTDHLWQRYRNARL
jgi:RIO kinase 1